MNKTEMEELLQNYGVAFTDALADKLIDVIRHERDDARETFIEEAKKDLATTDSGDYISSDDLMTLRDAYKSLEITEKRIWDKEKNKH